MLDEFLVENRATLIERCRVKVAARRAPRATPAELEHGIPLFLSQLTELLAQRTASPGDSDDVARDARFASAATRHGAELLQHGFTIEQVVHDYGDLCQSITALAAEQGAPITVQEFGLLNIKLDNAIAGAVTEYARPAAGTSPSTDASLGELAHEMRNLLNTTILAIAAIKGGTVGFNGATAAALDRSLIGMRELIDRTLADVRLRQSGPEAQVIELAPFIVEVQVAAALEAATKGCELTVSPVEPGIFVHADRHMLAAAVANLLQNAFKFTRAHSHVILRAYAIKGRVIIDVEDECGGLPPGTGDHIFQPFAQAGGDRTGIGLGLTISRKAVELSGGKLSARSIHGVGCVFTIDLPQHRGTAAPA